MIPSPMFDHGVYRHAAPLSIPLLGVTVGVAAITIWDILRRQGSADDSACLRRVSPIAILLCVWILKTPFTDIPRISTDDYHFGEALLPWVLWRDFGALPFADVMPARGFVSVMEGLMAEVFFSGNASDLAHLRPLLALALSAILFFPALYAGGPLLAALAV